MSETPTPQSDDTATGAPLPAAEDPTAGAAVSETAVTAEPLGKDRGAAVGQAAAVAEDEAPADEEAAHVGETPAPSPGEAASSPDARPAAPERAGVPAPPVPGSRPRVRPAAPPPREVPMDPHDAAEAAKWGRVDDDGTVWVREPSGERQVGQFPDATQDEALAFYVRRYLDLVAQVNLFEARIGHVSPKEAEQTMASLREQLTQPQAVGDLEGLRQRLAVAEERAEERRRQVQQEREAARTAAFAEREALVASAEAIAAQDPARTQWKQSGEELRNLLDAWKNAQRSGPRLDKQREDSLWKRFSKARTTFDRHRRQYFADLDTAQDAVKKAKEALITRAEELSASTDWGRTSGEYRLLMEEWKAAGRARRSDDDALWARFRAAQQRFFDARDSENRAIDEEYAKNLEVKLEILQEAEALVPVTDVSAARTALRALQDRWDAAGKVPRAEMQRVEGRMRAVEKAVKDVEDAEWQRSNPETQARVQGMTSQLENAIATLEAELAAARSTGDAAAVRSAEEALIARRAWLEQIQRSG